MSKWLAVLCTALVWCCYFCNIPAATSMANNATDRAALVAFKAAIVQDPLGLSKNKLSGTIPPFIGNLSSLFQIALSECNLHREIPAEIARLRGLRFVRLFENNRTTYLARFHLASTISPPSFRNIPPDIGSTLPNLKFLCLFKNLFAGTLPTSLSNASELELIDFSENDFSRTMPRDLGKLPDLRFIIVYQNRLQDDFTFISFLTNCTSLQVIEAGNNLLRGSLPDSVANLSTYLSYFNLRVNQIHGSFPSGIGNLLNLTLLSMATNNLSGPIPSSIGRLHKLQSLYLGHNKFTELPSSIGNLTSLITLTLEVNNIHGSIPPSLGNCHSLLELALSQNNLNGSLPPEIMSLSSISTFLLTHTRHAEQLFELGMASVGGQFIKLRGLRVLDLSRNNLSGLIPSFLGEIQLDMLNLSFNMLHGQVPTQGVFRNSSAISIVGNNELCGGIAKLDLPPCQSSKSINKKLSHRMKVILLVVGLVIFLSLFVSFFIFVQRRHVSKKKTSSTPSIKHQFLRVSYAELLKATNGFSEANLIGVGSYASVYKGILDHVQMVVAAKALNLQARGASKSFMSECKALRAIRHRNLLKILSVCSSVDFQGNEFKALKLDISTDIASALEYLHCGCESTIIHGDLKPSNVLLDDEMTTHIGDFGLEKIISTVSSDVAQGKKPTDDMFKEHLNLHNFVKNALPGHVMEIVDPCILLAHNTKSWIKDCMVSILRIGVACSMESPRDRVEMGSIILSSATPFFSTSLNPREREKKIITGGGGGGEG
ncbi:hypothetical protein ACSBR1_030625 [Camellia fascicularis]